MMSFLLLAAAATVVQRDLALMTYPYSEPDPVPATDKVRYPYCFFDGSSVTGEVRNWPAVVLENEKIAVTVMPRIGGKVWGAVDKRTGREFVYFNHSAKFRNIAMRGPWCSGGIEFNFGVVGHAPHTASPVDWCVRTNADGSVSCFVGDEERISGTSWQVEIRLAPGEERFTTRTTWFNGSGFSAPYYQWMNGAFSVRGNPTFVYPGRNWIGHDGSAHGWPIDDGVHDVSTYAGNDFGKAKSYHVVNGANGMFGIWWPEAEFGMRHASHVTAKYGRKIFLWSHARDGGIWEDLLTDADGQYVELQSGRCFNQQQEGSELTPWKNPTFAAGATDTFEEEWGVVRDFAAFGSALSGTNWTSRPLTTPKDFDWATAYGRFLKGEQALNVKNYRAAEAEYRAALAKDRHFAPASAALAELMVRRGLMSEAHRFAADALAIDTYDARANFADGRAFYDEGNLVAAKERLGIAAWSPLWRPEAYALVAKAELRAGDLDAAEAMAGKALEANALEREAWLVKIVTRRVRGTRAGADAAAVARKALERMPLFHAARFELNKIAPTGEKWTDYVRNEFPGETVAQLREWYVEIGRPQDAPQEVALGPRTFPYRLGTLKALRAERQTWKVRFDEAAILASLGRDAEAEALLAACGDEPDSEAFYLYRAKRKTGKAALRDLDLALKHPHTWRTGLARYAHFAACKDWERALEELRPYASADSRVSALKIAWGRALAESGRSREAIEFLRKTTVLPSEFGDNAYGIWQKAWRDLGDEAQANEYPENLGVGRPHAK